MRIKPSLFRKPNVGSVVALKEIMGYEGSFVLKITGNGEEKMFYAFRDPTGPMSHENTFHVLADSHILVLENDDTGHTRGLILGTSETGWFFRKG